MSWTDVPDPQALIYNVNRLMPEVIREMVLERLSAAGARLIKLAFEEDDPEAALEVIQAARRQGLDIHMWTYILDTFWRRGALRSLAAVAREIIREGDTMFQLQKPPKTLQEEIDHEILGGLYHSIWEPHRKVLALWADAAEKAIS